jgi:hypothetical protein
MTASIKGLELYPAALSRSRKDAEKLMRMAEDELASD